MAALPKFVVIKSASNETCLQLPIGNSRLPIFKELGDDSKGVKQEVVGANTGTGLVHIKCCDTGKYWTLAGTKDGSTYYITADSDKQVEDGTSAACTLIKPSQKNIGGVPVINFQIQRESKWHSLFLNRKGVLESAENAVAGDFIVADWEKLTRGGPRRGMNTTGGDARIEETAIEDGIAIANKAAVGYGRVSIFNTSYGVGGSGGGDGISVADVDIAAGGGKLTVGKRVIKGGIKIGYPPAP
jgi:hypothetical protein